MLKNRLKKNQYQSTYTFRTAKFSFKNIQLAHAKNQKNTGHEYIKLIDK